MDLKKLIPKVKVHNEFDIIVKDIKTGKTEAYKAYNMVLDNHPTWAVNGSVPLNISYGSGTGTLETSRTTLFNYVGNKASSQVEASFNRETGIYQQKRSIVILPAEHVGVTFTEVGFGNTSVVVTHAFIEDSEGNPISIGPKTDTQEITIFATKYWVIGNWGSYGNGANGISFPTSNATSPPDTDKNALLRTAENNGIAFTGAHYFLLGTSGIVVDYGSLSTPYSDTQSRTHCFGPVGTIKSMGTGSVVGGKRTHSTPRFGTSESNGEIREIGITPSSSTNPLGMVQPLARIVVENLPSSIWDGHQITGEQIGTGDGIETEFELSWQEPHNLVIKVGGVTKTEGADYEYSMFKKNIQWGFPHIVGSISITEQNLVATNWEVLFNGLSTSTNVNQRVSFTANDYFVLDLQKNQKWGIGAIEMRHDGSGTGVTFDIEVSADNVSWTKVVEDGAGAGTSADWRTCEFTTVPGTSYRYIRFTAKTTSSNGIREIRFVTRKEMIKFNTPPAAAVTADYKVKYIPKNSDHVLDIGGFAYEFGYNNG